MSERREVTEQLSAEQLFDELAKQDEMAADPGLQSVADANSTLKSLKEELDTLASQVREPAPVVPFEDESDCRRVTELVEALGLEPTQVGQSQFDTRPSEQKPLGELGQYQLLAKLGQGGMGTVYKALHTRLEKIVAIKLLPEQKTSDSQAVARFAQEMRAVGKLEHANIVRAMDANEHEETHYLVMEYVDGVDLSDMVRRLGPLPVADACELVRQAAVGLQHAHDHRLVHRDIKPSNLMLTRQGQLKILDLGLARLHNGNHGELTSTGQMMGTIDYMAPEQTGNSHNVDIRADIYGLGATLFKLLCDRAPYADERHDTVIKKLNALATQPVPSIRERREEVPEELSAIVTKMLAKEAGGRYATPQEVADALAPFCAGHDLAMLLEKATADDTQHAHDESKVATHESLRSGSVETDPTLDMPDSSPLPLGEDQGLQDSIESTQSMLPREADAFEMGLPPRSKGANAFGEGHKFGEDLPTSPKPPTEGLRQGDAGQASGRPAVDQVARSGDLATTSLQPWYTNRRNQIITVAAALGGVLLLAAVTLFFQTKDGTIVVEIDDPEGLIQVTVDGEDIVINDKNAGEPIRLKPGDHKLNVTRAGLEFSTDNFTLKRGDKTVITVKLVDGRVQIARDEKVTDSRPVPNYALSFDGRSNYVEIPTLKYDGSHPLTIEATVTPKGQNAEATFIGDTDIGGVNLKINKEGRWSMFFYTGEYQQLASRSRAEEGIRSHVAGVVDGAEIRLYVNGKLQSRQKINATFKPSEQMFVVGAEPDGLEFQYNFAYWFKGIIDEVRISKVARYDKDFEPPKPGARFKPDKHALGLYHFDEGEGDILHDASPNKHNGKIVGAKWVKVETMLDHEPAYQQSSIPRLAAWQPGPEDNVLPGLVPQPAKFDGIKRWQIETRYPRSRVRCVDVCPNGKLAAVGDDSGMVRIYDAETLELVRILCGHTHIVNDVAWSPDGELLASGGYDRTVRVWDRTGKTRQVLILDGDQGPKVADVPRTVYSIDWSPDNVRLAAGYDYQGTVIWDVAHGKPLHTFDIGDIFRVAWNPKGDRLATGARSGKLGIWKPDGTKIFEQQVCNDFCTALGWSPDGKTLVANGNDRIATLYSSDGEKQLTLPLDGQKFGILDAVEWTGDGSQFATLHYDITKIWNANGTLERTLPSGHPYEVLKWMPDGKSLVGAVRTYSNSRVELVALEGTAIASSAGTIAKLISGDWSPDGTEFVLSSYHSKYWCDFPRGELRATAYDSGVSRTSWSPNGSPVAFAGSETVLLGLQGEKSLRQIGQYNRRGRVFPVWNPAGTQFVTVGDSETVEVWNADGSSAGTITLEQSAYSSSWSPDGKQIVFGCDQKVYICESTGNLVQEIDTPDPQGIGSVAWHPSGDWIALCSPAKIHLVTPRGKRGPFWKVPLATQAQVAWSPDGTWLAASGFGGGVFLFDSSGKQGPVLDLKHTLTGEPSFAWSRNSRYLLTLGNYDQPTVWDVEKQEPVLLMTILGENESVSFNAAGQIIHGDRFLVEDKLVVIVENEDGSLDLLEPSEFEKRIGQSLTVEPYNTPAQHRQLAEFVIQHGGEVDGVSEIGKLPQEDFTIDHIKGKFITKENSVELGNLLRNVTIRYLDFVSVDGTDAILRDLEGLSAYGVAFAWSSDVTDAGIQTVANHDIRDLVIDGTSVTDAGLAHLQKSEGFRALAASNSQIGDDGVKQLIGLNQLYRLWLNNSKISDTALEHVAAITSLKDLSVRGCDVTEPAVLKLSKALPNCRIEWDGGVIEPTGDPNRRVAEWVLSRGGQAGIRRADGSHFVAAKREELPGEPFILDGVSSQQVTDEDLKTLTGLPAPTLDLHLAGAPITGRGLAAFKGKQLNWLQLSTTQVTDESLSGVLPDLAFNSLELEGTSIGDATLELLKGREYLWWLKLSGTQITDAGLRHLDGIEIVNLGAQRTVITGKGFNATGDLSALKNLQVDRTQFSDEGLKSISRAQSLTELNLDHTPVTDAGLKHLYQLKELRQLSIEGTSVTEAGVTALSKALPNCRIEWDGGVIEPTGGDVDRRAAEWVLSIGGTMIVRVNGSERGIGVGEDLPREAFELVMVNLGGNQKVNNASLAIFKECQNLTQIGLSKTSVSDAGLVHFQNCKNIIELGLGGTQVTDAGLVMFKDRNNVTRLYLDGTKVTDAGLAYFKDCRDLTLLFLGNTRVSDDGLANFKDCTQLGFLNLEATKVSDSGLAHFGRSKSVSYLDLRATQVSDLGLRHFQASTSLTAIYLNNTRITDTGLACFRNCKELTLLMLTNTEVSDAGLADFVDCKKLSLLHVQNTKVTEAGVRKFSAVLPGCKIAWDGGVIEPTTEISAAEFVAAGDAAFSKGDLEGSLKAYSQAIENALDDSQGYRGRGWVHLNRNDYAKALEDFNRAIQLDHNNGLAFGGRGWVYHHLGKLDEGLSDLNQAVRLLPNYSNSRHARGVVHYELKQYDDAIADLTEAIRLDPSYGWSYLYRSSAYEANKDTAKAEADRKKALELDPSLAEQLPK